jgi:hypothetical protein
MIATYIVIFARLGKEKPINLNINEMRPEDIK